MKTAVISILLAQLVCIIATQTLDLNLGLGSQFDNLGLGRISGIPRDSLSSSSHRFQAPLFEISRGIAQGNTGFSLHGGPVKDAKKDNAGPAKDKSAKKESAKDKTPVLGKDCDKLR